MALYRALLLLYPTSFRREYDALMIQLLADQLRDAGRVGRRGAVLRVQLAAARDVAASAWDQRVEVLMSRNPTNRILPAVALLGLAETAFVVSGVAASVLAAPLLVVAAALAVWTIYDRKRGRYQVLPQPRVWMRWLLVGVVLLALALVPGALSLDGDWLWGLASVVFVFGASLTTIGLLLAAAAARRRLRGA